MTLTLPTPIAPPPQRGLTLIEILVAVAIVGVLVSLAIPSYQEYIRRAARADVQLVLQQAANQLERRYVECNKYTKVDASTSPPCTTDLTDATAIAGLTESPIDAPTGKERYTISLNLAAQSYTLTATRANHQIGDRCGNFVLSSNGSRSISGQAAGVTVDQCWGR